MHVRNPLGVNLFKALDFTKNALGVINVGSNLTASTNWKFSSAGLEQLPSINELDDKARKSLLESP